jgi:hypothetical protein
VKERGLFIPNTGDEGEIISEREGVKECRQGGKEFGEECAPGGND